MIDLSFLTEEEQESIRSVLRRDAELKKAEEKRVQSLQRNIANKEQLRYMTGEWFYETKQRRHRDRIHGADIIRASMRHTQRPLTILELSHSRQERPSFVSSESRDVFVPPVLQGVLQEPQLELSEEMYEIRTPSPPAEDNPRPVSVSPLKERKNPFNSEDFSSEEKCEDQTQTQNEEPLSSCDSCTAPISDLDPDPSERQISQDASVPFPISEPRAGSATSEETSELDEPEDRQTTSAVPRSILKHLSPSSSSDSLFPHVDPQNPFCPDSPPEACIDRKQVRFSSMVGRNRPDCQDGKELGEHCLLDVDFMVSAGDERHSNTDVDSHGPPHNGQIDSQENKDCCKTKSVIQGPSIDQQDVHDDVPGRAMEALGSAVKHESGKLVDSKTGPEEDLVTTTDQPEVAVESRSEPVPEREEDVKEETEEVREAEQDGPDDSSTFYQSAEDTTVEKGVTEQRELSEVKTVQLTAMQKTTFKESVPSVDTDVAVQHPAVPSNLRTFWKKEHIVSAGEKAEHKDTSKAETDAASEAKNTNNKLLSQVELTEKADSSLIVVLSREDGTYRANPVLIYEESEDILTAAIRETDMFKIQESLVSPAPASLPLHGQKQKEETSDAPPQPSSPTPQEDRRAKISDLKNFWEKEVTKSREQAANAVGRSFRNKVASPQSDVRTFSLREKFEGAGPSKPSIIPKSLTVTEKGFVSQSLRSPEDVRSVSPESRVQADPEPQNKPLSPRRSQIPRAKEQDEETRRSPSKTCHPRVLPREPSSPKSQRLEGSPLKTFPIDIDPGTKNMEESQKKPTPVPKERKSPSHEAKPTPSPSPRVRDSPSHKATPAPEPAPAPRVRDSPSHKATPAPEPAPSPSPSPSPSPRVRDSPSHEAKTAPVLRERRSSSHEVKPIPAPRERLSPSHEAKQTTLSEPRNSSNIMIGDANTQSPSKSSSPQHRGNSEMKQTALTESKASSYITISDENTLPNTLNLSSPQHKKAPEKKLGTLTRLARSIIPQDYQYYLGPHEKAHVPPFTQESDALYSPQKSLRNTVGILRGSPTKGSPSRKKDEDPSQDMATGAHSLPRTSSGSYDDTPNIIMTSLRELSSKIKSTSKSLDNLASKTKKEKNQENPKEPTNQSVEDVSSSPSSSSEWKQLRSSASVPVLQQDETDSDSTLDTNLGLRRNTGSSRSNLSISSGLASMSSVSGSISSIYPADFGDIEVQGNIQFAVNYIQKLGEFHIFVVQCRDLAVADTKKQRSDPYVKCYLLPDKTKLGKRKTAVKKKTLNPDYNEILRFKISMELLKTQNLNVSVWHNDTFGRNSFLGDVEVDLSEWDFSNTHINDYALRAGVSAPTAALAPSLLPDSRGQMRVALRFLPQTPSGQSTSTMETSEVQIWVKDCKNLPPVRGVVIDPFVKCAVLPDTSRKSRQKTRVVKRTANPMFNHTMVYDGFRPDDLREACVEITVWDHDRLNNHYIGGVRLGLGTGKSYGVEVGWMDSTADEAHLWQRMLEADGEWVEDVLPLRMLVLAKSMSK